MQISSKQGGQIAVIMLTLCLPQLHARGDGATQTDNIATNTIRNDNDILQFINRTTRSEYAKRFAGPRIVPVDNDFLGKLQEISKHMEESRTSNNRGPQTIQEAIKFLRENVSMACLPTKCLEHDGIFYFSGGTSTKLIEDFSSGFAIRKGESMIYTWSLSEKKEIDTDKNRTEIGPDQQKK